MGNAAPQSLHLVYASKSYGVELAVDQPEFAAFWVDSLGKGRKWHSAMLGGNLLYNKDGLPASPFTTCGY